MTLREILDYEHGYLDRKHNMGYNNMGPTYQAGWDEVDRNQEDARRHNEQSVYRESLEHGWH